MPRITLILVIMFVHAASQISYAEDDYINSQNICELNFKRDSAFFDQELDLKSHLEKALPKGKASARFGNLVCGANTVKLHGFALHVKSSGTRFDRYERYNAEKVASHSDFDWEFDFFAGALKGPKSLPVRDRWSRALGCIEAHSEQRFKPEISNRCGTSRYPSWIKYIDHLPTESSCGLRIHTLFAETVELFLTLPVPDCKSVGVSSRNLTAHINYAVDAVRVFEKELGNIGALN